MSRWTVPGYTELGELGSGGFGRVVLARHDDSGTVVAIKYLNTEQLGGETFLAQFRDEARTLATLDSPYVTRLYEYVEGEDHAAIVMEAVDGASLRAVLDAHGPAGPEAALSVLRGSLLGLAAAHAASVVHRDYKPANVLVGQDGQSKVADFGIAVRSGESGRPAGRRPTWRQSSGRADRPVPRPMSTRRPASSSSASRAIGRTTVIRRRCGVST
ncbi:hypothetical protein GCM10029978_101950 [Actinoallomurus acanthiterrae]